MRGAQIQTFKNSIQLFKTKNIMKILLLILLIPMIIEGQTYIYHRQDKISIKYIETNTNITKKNGNNHHSIFLKETNKKECLSYEKCNQNKNIDDMDSSNDSSKDKSKYYLISKINVYIGYNNSQEWGYYYFPYRKQKYFFNINYQFYTSNSPTFDTFTFGLLNELGINTVQVYYKAGLLFNLSSNFYLNTNLGLFYTWSLGGGVLNDIILGMQFEIKNEIFLRIEFGINNIFDFGLPSSPFFKTGLGFQL